MCSFGRVNYSVLGNLVFFTNTWASSGNEHEIKINIHQPCFSHDALSHSLIMYMYMRWTAQIPLSHMQRPLLHVPCPLQAIGCPGQLTAFTSWTFLFMKSFWWRGSSLDVFSVDLMSKIQFSFSTPTTPSSNPVITSNSYYRTSIGSHIRSIAWWHFQWPCRTPNPVFEVKTFLKSNIS